MSNKPSQIVQMFLTKNCVQDLPEQHEIVSATKVFTSVEEEVMETNINAAVRGLILVYPPISLTHI